MEELQGFFVGYKTFTSQKNNKKYNVISLIFVDLDEANQRATYFVKDIFTDEKTYNNFVTENELLSLISVKREIVGDNVRYYI